ncbi:MAG TPA: 50S ribosomal protein L29 [Candidatus Paceibacterota bacterium]|nr:50S ribosomal protein L29 [Candidatus Paceibacterota bacterium]
MKRKELQNFRAKTTPEVDKEIRHYEERLNALKMDLALGKVKNIREIRQIRKSLAQLLTIKRERARERTVK